MANIIIMKIDISTEKQNNFCLITLSVNDNSKFIDKNGDTVSVIFINRFIKSSSETIFNWVQRSVTVMH